MSQDGGDIACAGFDRVVSVLSKNIEHISKEKENENMFTKL